MSFFGILIEMLVWYSIRFGPDQSSESRCSDMLPVANCHAAFRFLPMDQR